MPLTSYQPELNKLKQGQNTMKTYLLVWITDIDNLWPSVESTVTEESDEMACNYAARLLQSWSNTMFVTVRVFELHEYAGNEDRQVAVIDLHTSREAKRRSE